MSRDTPKQGEEILSLANENGWDTNVSREEVPVTLVYDDNSKRNVMTDTYQLVGSKDKAMFMIGWYINPHSDRWNVSLKRAILITANEVEIRIADAMDLLPQYVYWEMGYKHFKDWLSASDPEGILRNWNEDWDA